MEKNRKKRQKTRFCSLSGGVIALIFALCLNLLSGCAPVSNGKAPSLLDYDIDVYRVLLREATGANTQAQNALSLCLSLLTSLRFGSEEDWTDERLAPIDEMMAYYYENGVLPRDPYPGIGDYCSVMDAPLLAVTTELVFERTDEERFHQYTLDLIPYCTKSTEEGGFVLKLSDSEWWPLEYAWKTVTEEDAWFTLNGSLFGMVCVEMLKNLTQDAGLTELSEKALAAYRNRMDAFLYPDGSWFKYSLNGPDGAYVVNRPEKVFIEINSLRALHILTGEQDY
ncbi:MAG: hypothetical protein IJK52_03125, partial [Oscillospiraceae bacterium]|nr:hypothetical protein [Oscillospiraceae bacterium]